MSSIALASPWEGGFDVAAARRNLDAGARRAVEVGADMWNRTRRPVSVFVITALAAAILPHLMQGLWSATTSTGAVAPASQAIAAAPLSPLSPAAPQAAPRTPYGSLATLEQSGPTGDARVGAGGALAVATKAPASPNCGGSVKSTLASSGFQPPRLADTTPGATVASIQKSIAGACDAGIPAPQVAAQTLKNAAYGPITIASFLASGFGQSATQAAGVLQ
ncbi:MAG: hypothetical protein QOG43_1018, partial [Actinomycetota bacterium]|nr:hypothetical protein [Actinomycetota bacterium]